MGGTLIFILPTNSHEFSRKIFYFVFFILYFVLPCLASSLPIFFLILNSFFFCLFSFFLFPSASIRSLRSSRRFGIRYAPTRPPAGRTSSSPQGWGRIETAGSVYPAMRCAETLPPCGSGAFSQMEAALTGNAFHSRFGQRVEILGLKPEELGVASQTAI